MRSMDTQWESCGSDKRPAWSQHQTKYVPGIIYPGMIRIHLTGCDWMPMRGGDGEMLQNGVFF